MKYIWKYWYFVPPFVGILIILFRHQLMILIQENLIDFVCPLHILTGLYCPFCGGTRSSIALLQGNLTESLRENPLVILICIVLIQLYFQAVTKRRIFPKHPAFWKVCAVGFVSWGIIRNFVPFLMP